MMPQKVNNTKPQMETLKNPKTQQCQGQHQYAAHKGSHPKLGMSGSRKPASDARTSFAIAPNPWRIKGDRPFHRRKQVYIIGKTDCRSDPPLSFYEQHCQTFRRMAKEGGVAKDGAP